MAQIPYTSEIKSKKIATDLATRLYQFMQVNKLIDGLGILNGSKQNNEDLRIFGDELEKFYTDYMNDSMDKEKLAEAKQIFNADTELMDTADRIASAESQENKFTEISAYIAKKVSRIVTEQTYHALAEGSTDNVELNLEGILFIILEKENSKIDARDFAHRILNGNIQQDEIPTVVNALQSAKQKVMQRLKADWQTYEDTRTRNPNIEKFRKYFESQLTESKEFRYKAYPETRNVLLCIRDDFADVKTGSKNLFLKMNGFMFDCGHLQLASATPIAAKIRNDKNYAQFISLIKQQYPDNSEQVINDMLDMADSDYTEKERRAAFEKKSKELYCKFLSALLVKKLEANNAENIVNFDYQKYINHNVADYINDMKEGKNNIAKHLHLVDESKTKSFKELIDDTSENQIISVHHKIPVAAAVPLYIAQHPTLHSPVKAHDMLTDLRKICPNVTQKYTENDILTIGFALSVFTQECKKDNIADIYKITDEEEKAKALQTIKNKEAIRDVYAKYFSFDNQTLKAAGEDILRIVNDPGNHTLPLGKIVHQKMEPNGYLCIAKPDDRLFINVTNTSRLTDTTTINKVNNSTVFAAEYDIAALKETVRKLNPNFKQGLEQYNPLLRNNPNQKNQPLHQTVAVQVSLKMPETYFMRCVRNMLNSMQQQHPIQDLKKFIGFTK